MSYYRPFDSKQPAPWGFHGVPGTLIDPAEVREAKRRVMLKRALRRNGFIVHGDTHTADLKSMVRRLVEIRAR